MRIARISSILVLLAATVLFYTALFYAAPAAAQETEQPKQEQPTEGQGLPGQEQPVEGEGEAMGDIMGDVDTDAPVAPTLAGAALSDAQILHVFRTANQGEVVTSEPIGDGAEEEVAAYARHMIDKHADVLARIDSLAGVMGVEPQENMVSATLTQVAQGIADRLAGLDDPDHRDMTYMESQVALHKQTLDLLDFVLIPNAQDAALRTMLSQARATVMRHLEQAKEIHDGLD